MTGVALKARTAFALGLPNIARAGSYRFGVKLGLNPVRRLQAPVPPGPFFLPVAQAAVSAPAMSAWQESALLFSHWPFPVGAQSPDWLANPFNRQRVAAPERGWWQIPDFDPVVGDIKLIWELSRLDWTLALAQRARQGDGGSLDRLNTWLADWCSHNPPYLGPNWKCGQEASIRVMHLAMTGLMLGQARQPAASLQELVRLHLQRIEPTVQYAMAQDNNHGTSEAAALFMGGSWLTTQGQAEGKRWERLGRKWLENRAAKLIGPQGSFSQYSLNYHRLMLDTFCMVEVWRRHLGLADFSAAWQQRALVATQWLHHMIDAASGDGPNLGANDGARLLQLTDTPYRDHRPTLQLAMALFAGRRAIEEAGPWDHPLRWLGVPVPVECAPRPSNYVANDGGFAVLRRGRAMAMLRYPRFRFRPSQCDVLHLDLWLGDSNVLRDGGSYSYNTEPKWLDYFGGTASHNTIQFDNREQMPRLSRFLLGDWLQTSFMEPLHEGETETCFAAGYQDRQGASHRRHIRLGNASLHVRDEVAGFRQKAVMRWRLAPAGWRLERSADGSLRVIAGEGDLSVLTVQANVPIVRCELVEGWESRHYLEKKPLPVLEIEIAQAGAITTRFDWTA